jgi:hypothetical protein
MSIGHCSDCGHYGSRSIGHYSDCGHYGSRFNRAATQVVRTACGHTGVWYKIWTCMVRLHQPESALPGSKRVASQSIRWCQAGNSGGYATAIPLQAGRTGTRVACRRPFLRVPRGLARSQKIRLSVKSASGQVGCCQDCPGASRPACWRPGCCRPILRAVGRPAAS